jgi:tetratricopeptide (TPR) repeat protein
MRERPLGASPIDLECLSRFTGSDWNPKAALNEEDQRFVLHEVAHYLFLLGRLNESSLIFPKAVSTHVAAGKWGSAAAAARLSSDLYRELGRLDQAQQLAEQAIHYARQEAGSDQTQTGILRICMNTAWLGLVHYLRGEAAVADGLLKEAEHIEKSINRDACFLTSFPGWCFCERLMEQAKDDFKLKQVELTEPLVSRINNLQERASFVRRIGESQNRLLDVAQAELILGQLLVLKHLLNESVSKCEALSVLKGAVCKLRRSGQLHHVAYGLVRRAEMNGLLTQYDAAQADLDEAWEIAERGPMRLHMADILLTRCRLFGMPGAEAEKGDGGRKYPWDKNLDGSFRGPKDDLAEARKLIERCGYWRRKEELEDAERALGG